MGTKVRVEHQTRYVFDRSVDLYPHIVRLHPAPHAMTPIEAYSFDVGPADHIVTWQQDPFGNVVARIAFPYRARSLSIDVGFIAEMEPVAAWISPAAAPTDVSPYRRLVDELFEGSGPGELVQAWVDDFPTQYGTDTIDFLIAVNHAVYATVDYIVREEPGVQTPDRTLRTRAGADRDSAWLLVSILRQMGVAARFVSGYLVCLGFDERDDFAALHAWVEAFVPDAGWVGLDTTSGMLTGAEHIPLAAAPHHHLAAPLEGQTGVCGVTLDYSHTVTRLSD